LGHKLDVTNFLFAKTWGVDDQSLLGPYGYVFSLFIMPYLCNE